MFATFLSLLITHAPAAEAAGQTAPNPQSPAEIVAAAPAGDWFAIPPEELLVIEIGGSPAQPGGRVVIQLMPRPFATSWIANIRALASAGWWNGTSINRVQDNYVVQWGDATERKPLPAGLQLSPESAYSIDAEALPASEITPGPPDVYTPVTAFFRGWPLGQDATNVAERQAWPVHCYGMVGVGRDVSPDTGSGAELYAVIGHAPRHLDRNIALVGRVIEGMEMLASLPRGTAPLGFYEKAEQRIPLTRIRLAQELPATEQPRFAYLSTASASWAQYVIARSNRRDAFFVRPAGAADICNLPVPIRRLP